MQGTVDNPCLLHSTSTQGVVWTEAFMDFVESIKVEASIGKPKAAVRKAPHAAQDGPRK
jgi:hypothetical protein